MGLFSFVGKIAKTVGKLAAPVLKAVASKATGGLSDSILKKLKGNPAKPSPSQVEALVHRTGGYGPPKLSKTESSEGWGYGKDPVKRKPMQTRPARPRSRKPAKPRSAKKAAPTKPRVKRKAPASFAAGAAKMKQLAADWRGLGGKDGTGQTFFEWKRGK